MLVRLSIILLLVAPLWSQVETTASVGTTDAVADSDSRMLTPPAVSGESYPTAGTAETRSNFLRAGLTFNSAYSDNVLGFSSEGHPVSDISYSILPFISLDETTPRLHSVLTYSPGFTFYDRTSGRNEVDQALGVNFQYRLSPHVTLTVRDNFRQSSNVLNQPDLASAVPGGGQTPIVAVIAPIAEVLTNNASAQLTYQFAANAMVGASGTFTNLHYPNPSQVPGLYDSSSKGGSAFYSHRLSKKHYIGATYQYQQILSFPANGQDETQTHTISAFYTIYLKPTFSMSFTGGPQYSDIAQPLFPTSRAWSPSASASLGWQGRHTTLSGGYSRTVTGGGGLLGAYHSNSANGSASWQFARWWSTNVGANYSIYKNVESFLLQANQGGHTISGTASVRRQLGEHMSAEVGYTRLHQSYDGIALVSAYPDTNREFVSISYNFARPLGR